MDGKAGLIFGHKRSTYFERDQLRQVTLLTKVSFAHLTISRGNDNRTTYPARWEYRIVGVLCSPRFLLGADRALSGSSFKAYGLAPRKTGWRGSWHVSEGGGI